MDLKHKHLAVISSGALIAIFLGLAVWYMASHPAPVAIAPITATTTPITEPAQTNKTIIDLHKYYEIRAKYPLQVPIKEGGTAAQQTMESFVKDQIATFKSESNLDSLTPEDIKMQGLDQGQTYALTIAYTTHTTNSTISYDYEIYANTLGAHPNTYYRTFTFDSTTGQPLQIGDLFVPGAKYLATLSTIARAKLPAIIADREHVSVAEVSTEMLEAGTKPEATSFQNFYLENGNLVLVFAPYQVGPYALGTILLPIPLSSLKISLNSKYLR
ncbi:MAG: DUF3298 domain-containing protein [Candidatus Paceibacterota bacterium]